MLYHNSPIRYFSAIRRNQSWRRIGSTFVTVAMILAAPAAASAGDDLLPLVLLSAIDTSVEMAPAQPVEETVELQDDGGTCGGHDECASNYCFPFPDGNRYCLAAERNCAAPGLDGLMFYETASWHGAIYECSPESGWTYQTSESNLPYTFPLKRKFDHGDRCWDNDVCESGFCYPYADGNRYCLASDANCARPGRVGELYGFEEFYAPIGEYIVCQEGGWGTSGGGQPVGGGITGDGTFILPIFGGGNGSFFDGIGNLPGLGGGNGSFFDG
jgi:hypothetical protein